MRICAVDGCERSHYASTYCNPHWRRWKRHGDPGPAAIGPARSPFRTCSLEGCDLAHSAKGYCVTHYAQHRRNREVKLTHRRSRPAVRDAEGRKECPKCDQWKPEDQFYAHSKTRDRLTSICRECTADRVYRDRYGIGLAEYQEMFDSQGGGCAICGGTNPGGRALSIDHDHRCCPGQKSCGKCVRGLLCGCCNQGIGMLGDDEDRLNAAIAYVRKWRA